MGSYIYFRVGMYIVDVRERALIPLLTDPKVKSLPIADIWIGISGEDISSPEPPLIPGALLIERKTIRDLEASVLDGRYREQKQRLLAYCQQTGAVPIYIIEGSYFTTTGRISPQALMKLVTRMQCKHNIAVIHTQSLPETSQVIEALHTYFLEDSTNFQSTSVAPRAIEGIHVQKKVNSGQPIHFAVACLAQCPGISTKIAEAIIAEFGSWQELLGASQDKIQVIIQPNGRKVGPAIAKRIYDLLHAPWV
jgi:ERCC4-type nuclease